MKRLYSIYSILGMLFFLCLTSCVDLDIAPKNVLQNEEVYTEAGIKAYMAGMYRNLPMEDFHYAANSGTGYFRDLCIWQIGTRTGEMGNEDSGNGQNHRAGYWGDGFNIIRQANKLIIELPTYPDLADFTGAWIAEAKFIRAYVYFQLAKRYGGLPIIEAPQTLNLDDPSTLWVTRSSHEATFDFILKDLDEAIAGLPETSERARTNKYVAAGIKSRAALYAATTAKYGHERFPDWEIDGILLQGIPIGRAEGYFKQAWDATDLIVDGGKYSLHEGNADKVANFAEVWEKADNTSETIWIRNYDYNSYRHSFDALFSPVRMTTTYGGRLGIPLDWIELFDGLPLDAIGHFSAFDANGDYIVYDNARQMWDATEPRLQAQLLLPGTMFKGFKVDVRSGIFKPEINPAVNKYKKFSIDDGATSFNYRSHQTDDRLAQKNMFVVPDNASTANNPIITQNRLNTQSEVRVIYTSDRSDSSIVFIAGLEGPKMNWNSEGSTMYGVLGKKYLNMSMSLAATKLHESVQPWVEMRYAEILLNRAEAAIELAQNGVPTYNSVDMLQDAFECINKVRNRAGAIALTTKSDLSTDPAYTRHALPGPKGQGGWVYAPNRALQILRVERYKELSNESKLYWDMMRWFTFDLQFENTNKRGLYSFMFTNEALTKNIVDEFGFPNGKYIYDAKQGEHYSGQYTFNRNSYYEGIPSSELQNNPLLQKNRNQ